MEMTKTLLSMPTRTLGRLKGMAQRRKTTVSHLLREAVEKTYGIDAGLAREPDWKEDPLVKLFGAIRVPKGAPTDLAENHDLYLYGWDKKRKRSK
jgi:hypothetical protein